MHYFLIAGEASGDLHAAHLMTALKRLDPEARFTFYGGDRMAAVGGEMLCHYRHLAYMGFIPVLLHARTILRGLARCKESIRQLRPDAVIPVDYPGFNLKVARYVTREHICPVYYYISPKIWAWKEHRIRAIRRDVTHVFSILPFETDYFRRRHAYPVTYVGNPSHEEVTAYLRSHAGVKKEENLIALLPGSRRQEIYDNLGRMLRAAAPRVEEGYRLSVAAAPSIPRTVYDDVIRRSGIDARCVTLVEGGTYDLLMRASTALVTSGTATLEAALFRTPMAVCYYTSMGPLVSFLRRRLLRVPFVSLVNLIADREVVPELIAGDMTVCRVSDTLERLLHDADYRRAQLQGFDEMTARLGRSDASDCAARALFDLLTEKKEE